MSATIVVDLGFGDAGKGSIVDYLARRASKVSAVVRFNGGSQAAHNVITPEGIHHTFSQFGSATFVPGVRTFLSRFMLVDPLNMANEANHLIECGCGDPFDRLSVDAEAMVVTKYHKIANRTRETLRGDARHGSCGMGIGEAMALSQSHPDLVIRVKDLRDRNQLSVKLRRLSDWLLSEFQYPERDSHVEGLGELADTLSESLWEIGQRIDVVDPSYLHLLANDGDLIFEGAQGVLLDENHGFHPHTTWSTCTFKNAETLLYEIGYDKAMTRLGVLRAYMTRHGPGPFPTENILLAKHLTEEHNTTGQWQGQFRFGHFDAVLARYAIEVCGGIDALAITNIDKIMGDFADESRLVCSSYTHANGKTSRLPPLCEPNLAAQTALGRFVNLCYPNYTQAWPVEGGRHGGFLGLIEKELEMPITIKSYGPTAADKLPAIS